MYKWCYRAILLPLLVPASHNCNVTCSSLRSTILEYTQEKTKRIENCEVVKCDLCHLVGCAIGWVNPVLTAVFLELDTPHGIVMKEEIYGLAEVFRNTEYILDVPSNLPGKKNDHKALMLRNISVFLEFDF